MEKILLTLEDIKKEIPHRDPLLLLDRVEIIEENKAVGYKLIHPEMAVLAGHFPGNPIMPGVLQVESIAQLSAILAKPKEGELMLLAAVNKARFMKPVLPGMEMCVHVEKKVLRMGIGKFFGEVFVDGELACSAEVTGAIAPA